MTVRRLLFVLAVCLRLAGQTGTPLQAFDDVMTRVIAKYNLPGGALAITRNGQLVLAHGYGYSDLNRQSPTLPDARFRIASLSKAITATAVMHLVEQGKLDLDRPVFAMLPELEPAAGAAVDPRIRNITIRHLLTHSGGWDTNAAGFDPMFDSSNQIVADRGVQAPATPANTIRWMLAKPLQFDPGTHFVYSNFGYSVLGRAIEKVTGMSYEQYVRMNVLAPMGISRMRVGNTLPQGRLPGEVQYDSSPFGSYDNVFPDYAQSTVDWAYGHWCLECLDSDAGWVSSTLEYAKFLNALDGRRGQAFLTPASLAAITARPPLPEFTAGSWYGFGMWVVPATGGGVYTWHMGDLEGSGSYFVKTADGTVWVALFNGLPSVGEDVMWADVDSGMWAAYGQTADWPAGDGFTAYPDQAASAPAIAASEGVSNGATFDRGIVSGSWVTLKGVNLSDTTRIWTAADIVNGRLPESLDGVSVRIDGRPAYVYYVSPTQINVQAPGGLAPSWVTVEVARNGVSSEPVLAHAVNSAPGAFTYLSAGQPSAVATFADGALTGDQRPAAPGDTLEIYSTGLAASPAGLSALAVAPVDGVQVTIGGQPASVAFAGLTAPGVFQINVVVPAVPGGPQELRIGVNGVRSPPGVSVPVR